MSDSMRIPPSKIIEELRADLAIARDHCREYRRNWDEAKNEIASLTEERDEAEAEVARLKRGEFTPDEFREIAKNWSDEDIDEFRGICTDHWAKLFGDAGLEYSVGEDGVERYGFETVTVFRREGRESFAYRHDADSWVANMEFSERSFGGVGSAEAWCVEQLKPKWRAAREDGSDNGKKCRVKGLPIEGLENWIPGTLLAYDECTQGGPWVVRSQNGWINVSPVCEVQD